MTPEIAGIVIRIAIITIGLTSSSNEKLSIAAIKTPAESPITINPPIEIFVMFIY
jgi:hypothetical protein